MDTPQTAREDMQLQKKNGSSTMPVGQSDLPVLPQSSFPTLAFLPNIAPQTALQRFRSILCVSPAETCEQVVYYDEAPRELREFVCCVTASVVVCGTSFGVWHCLRSLTLYFRSVQIFWCVLKYA